jgi:hypothetical protein
MTRFLDVIYLGNKRKILRGVRKCVTLLCRIGVSNTILYLQKVIKSSLKPILGRFLNLKKLSLLKTVGNRLFQITRGMGICIFGMSLWLFCVRH